MKKITLLLVGFMALSLATPAKAKFVDTVQKVIDEARSLYEQECSLTTRPWCQKLKALMRLQEDRWEELARVDPVTASMEKLDLASDRHQEALKALFNFVYQKRRELAKAPN